MRQDEKWPAILELKHQLLVSEFAVMLKAEPDYAFLFSVIYVMRLRFRVSANAARHPGKFSITNRVVNPISALVFFRVFGP